MATGVALLLVTVAGCQQLATMWYFLRPPLKTEKAEYPLKSSGILVLVDDNEGLVKPPMAREYLVDALAREFKDHKVTNKVTTNEEIARIRQAEPKFDERGARELGQLAEADTVVLLTVSAFAMEDELELAAAPAKFGVSVRVIDAKAEARDKVRLWPSELTEREGRTVECEIPPHELRKFKTATQAHEELAKKLADEIAILFYDHQVEQ
jgi:hypothetical protein